MNVIEIFASIDGEGSRQGLLTTFLRLHDCNIRCSYCDTTYSYGIDSTFTDMTVREVADAIESLGNHRITITGGEPLLQEAAVVELIDELNRRKAIKLEDKPCTDKNRFLEIMYPKAFKAYYLMKILTISILKQMALLYRAFIEIMCGLPTITRRHHLWQKSL